MPNTLASYILWNSEFSHLGEELTQRSSKPSIYAETNKITRKVMQTVIMISSLKDTSNLAYTHERASNLQTNNTLTTPV